MPAGHRLEQQQTNLALIAISDDEPPILCAGASERYGTKGDLES